MRQKDKVAYDERYLWEQFNRPFGTRRTILADPPLKGWAILESPSGRLQVSHFHMAKMSKLQSRVAAIERPFGNRGSIASPGFVTFFSMFPLLARVGAILLRHSVAGSMAPVRP